MVQRVEKYQPQNNQDAVKMKSIFLNYAQKNLRSQQMNPISTDGMQMLLFILKK